MGPGRVAGVPSYIAVAYRYACPVRGDAATRVLGFACQAETETLTLKKEHSDPDDIVNTKVEFKAGVGI